MGTKIIQRFSFARRVPRFEYWIALALALSFSILAAVMGTAGSYITERSIYGDPVAVLKSNPLSSNMTEEQWQFLGERLGIDDPHYIQYVGWVKVVYLDGHFNEWIQTGNPGFLLGKDEDIVRRTVQPELAAKNLLWQRVMLFLMAVGISIIVLNWSATVVCRVRDIGRNGLPLLAISLPFGGMTLLVLGFLPSDYRKS